MEPDTVDTVDTVPVILDKGTVLTTGRGRGWSITWNNYTQEELTQLTQLVEGCCSDWALQEETGEKTGTPHIQAALYFKTARTFEQVKKMLPKCHIEPVKNWKALKNYCSKEETRTGKTFTKEGTKVKDPLEGKKPYAWQEELLKELEKEADDRSIWWFWEETGNVGKTTLAKHICLKNPDAIYVCGKAADMKYGITEMVNKGKHPRIVLVDLTRTTENFTGSLYQGLEEIKNGIFFNTKYECGMVMFNSPHLIIFANWEPDTSALSKDRWRIKKVGK